MSEDSEEEIGVLYVSSTTHTVRSVYVGICNF